ncbi:hypothetical protein D3C78_1278430 [compost metagenome]
MGRFTIEHRIGQAKDVEARTVGHRRLHRFNGDLTPFGHQFELFDFLGGGQQVALDPCCDQLNRVLAGGQPGLGQALADPAGQLGDIDWPDLHELGLLSFDQRFAPLGFLRAAIEFRQADQQHGVVGRARAVLDQRGGALVAGFAGRQAQFQQALFGEQRHAGTGLQQRPPVETGVGGKHLAFIESLLAGGSANSVGRLLAQQRVIAADDIDRRKGALQVFGELGGGELHKRGRTGRTGAP